MLRNNLRQKEPRINALRFPCGPIEEKRVGRRTVTFRVVNNRMQFRCSRCGARRNVPVPANLRRKNIRCHKCETVIKCMLNRRATPRQVQSGKAEMIINEGKKIEVNIYDISIDGIGIDIPFRAVRAIAIGQKVRFSCSWNSRLIGNSYFVVKSIKGHRAGLKKIIRRRG